VRLTLVENATVRDLVPKVDILSDRETVDNVQLLVHRRNPKFESRDWTADPDGFALPTNLAGVWMMRARERLNEGRFASAVLAKDTVNLAGTDVEVDPGERTRGAEGLGEAPHLK